MRLSEANSSPSSQAEDDTFPDREEQEGGENVDTFIDGNYEPDEEETDSTGKYVDADDASVASSTMSDGGHTVDLRTLVDLSDPGAFCMVLMRKRYNALSIPCVCGNPSDSCQLKGHSAKRSQGNPSNLGQPGFYVELLNVKGIATGAGRTDMRWYNREEHAFLLQGRTTELQDLEETLASSEDLSAVEPEDPPVYSTPRGRRRGTTVRLGGVSVIPSPSAVLVPGTHPNPTPRVANRSKVKKAPTKLSPDTIIGPPAPAPPAATGPWFCVRKSNGQRLATNSASQAMEWQSDSHQLVKMVDNKGQAAAWCNETPNTSTDHVLGPAARSEHAGPNLSPLSETGQTVLLKRISLMSSGSDPSIGTQFIYGKDPSSGRDMDTFLLPPGLEDGEAKADFYDFSMDVTSLPGGYRFHDDDDSTNTEALLAAMGKGRHTQYRNWRKSSLNPLAGITSSVELLRHVADVETTVVRTRKSQDQRMRKYLHACCHNPSMVDLYVTNGPLPRLVEQMYRDYMAMLNIMRSAVFQFPDETWKGSYIQQMIAHHASELGQIRATAADYRMQTLETYVYLRNSRKEKFQDPSFTRSLLYRLGSCGPTAEGENSPAGSGTTPPVRCEYCRRGGVHSGTSKEDCTLKLLSRTKAQSALQGLNKTQAKKVARAIAASMTNNPAGNVDEFIASARAAA